MFWLKKCPQCGGDLLEESDVHGTYVGCLQCGRMLTAAEERAMKRDASAHRAASSRRREGAA